MPTRVYSRHDPLVWVADGRTRRLEGDGFTASITYVTKRDRGAGCDWEVRGARPGHATEHASGHSSSGAAAKTDVATWLEARNLIAYDEDFRPADAG